MATSTGAYPATEGETTPSATNFAEDDLLQLDDAWWQQM